MIYLYNTNVEDNTSKANNFLIGKDSPLANPFTFNGVRSNVAKLSFKTVEEALKAYETYFKECYGSDEEFTKAFDAIYERYKNGEDIYLQCFCKPEPCHGECIIKELQRKLIRDKRAELKRK